MIEHKYRDTNGWWLICFCDNPFDSHELISFGNVPLLEKRVPGKLGDINLWNI